MAKDTSNGAPSSAKLGNAEIEARVSDLVSKLRAVEAKKEAKKAEAKRLGKAIKALEEEIAELREEIATGMLAPSKRQASLALDDAPANGEGKPKAKRKRAAKKGPKGPPPKPGEVKTSPAEVKERKAQREGSPA